MSNVIKVYEGQTIYDVALQHTGLVDNAYPIYLHNYAQGIMVDFDDDISNSSIEIPEGLKLNKNVLKFYNKQKSILINK